MAYDRDNLSPNKSHRTNLSKTLSLGRRRGAADGCASGGLGRQGLPRRASFLAWLKSNRLDYVVRVKKGTCITAEASGHRWKLGEEALKLGELRFVEGVRYGLYHDRPRELSINVALCWRISKSRAKNPRRERPKEPWYLATSLKNAKSAASWYWQRGWIEQSFKDAKSRFGLARVRVGCPERLSRLLIALSLALSWLTLMGLPEGGVVPEGFRSSVSAWGRASVISTARSRC